MIFEGSEKKVEIIVKDIDLRSMGQEFWAEVVAHANATILSVISNQTVDAYLLSESSLFVWNDRVTMITCGTTTLVRAIEKMTEAFGQDKIKVLVFQRKNEHFSHLQNSTFYDDIERIQNRHQGKAMRFGHKHEHHNFLFHSSCAFTPEADDTTCEILMYDLQGEAKTFLVQENLSANQIREFFSLEEILAGFEIDDFSFNPFGYSMNAIKDHFYCTIHITPQESCSYMSFETNLPTNQQTEGIFRSLLKRANPESFDTVTFNCDLKDFVSNEYRLKTVAEDDLEIGYRVNFSHYYRPQTSAKKAAPIERSE